MKEDWIKEECNRVEAELALKEARSKIKQLKQVIEAMKNNAVEKDQIIQKCLIDISIQNKKLESSLQSIEMAQNSSAMDEQCLQYSCDAEGKPSALCATMPESLMAGDQALEEVADSRLLLSEDTPNGTDSAEESWSTAASEWSDSQTGVIPRAAVLQHQHGDGGKNSNRVRVQSRRGRSNAGGLTCKRAATPRSF